VSLCVCVCVCVCYALALVPYSWMDNHETDYAQRRERIALRPRWREKQEVLLRHHREAWLEGMICKASLGKFGHLADLSIFITKVIAF
jgi:hypothetical protein